MPHAGVRNGPRSTAGSPEYVMGLGKSRHAVLRTVTNLRCIPAMMLLSVT
ncbi:hypothetical protein J2S55_000909 [Streptosporangium brasiliense]|uniref:Uncharacterized protein n=1 Tax=Streptosporangium brasiliense TaxID=47480 RepID=A0ABT9QZM0_9ACTN|nr:hypothetical protein [Streptosporangium brasiliense]